MNRSHVTPEKPAPRRRLKGQSLVELALAMPVLLILFSGLAEFGFALNQYLNALDAAREGARYASDGDPTARDVAAFPGYTDLPCGTSGDYYILASCVAQSTMAPVPLNPNTDDVVISVFRVLTGRVYGRWPDCGNSLTSGHPPSIANSSCPNDPPFLTHSGNWPETMGEWHRWGRGDQCANGLDDNGDGNKDEACQGNPSPSGAIETTCDPNTDYTCNPSHFTMAQIQALLDPTAPNTAVVLVEVFYNYNQLLKLPWITAFVPDPQRLHSYTIIPVPAAEPSLTISGTVTNQSNGTGKPDVTISFSNGIIAITDGSGNYSAKGFDSTPITATASFPGCTFTPPFYNLTPINDIPNVDFVADCPPTATPTNSPSPTATPNLTQSPTPTPTPTQTETPTQTPSPTITRTPTATQSCVAGQFDASKSTMSLVNPPTGIVPSDGISTAELVVTILDNCSNPMVGRFVTMASSRGNPPDIINPLSPGSDTTNGTGQAFFTVSSSVMSPWNSGTNSFTPSVMTARDNTSGTALSSTRNVFFECVVGQGLPAGGNSEVFWQFTNNTGLTRRLVRLDVTWPQASGRLLQLVEFNGTTIWNLTANFSPVTINSGWVGSPASRNINNTVAQSLLITFNFLVTGAQNYTVNAYWDDTNGGSVCSSGSVTVQRGSPWTATPTSTRTPTMTPTMTPTRTPTKTPTP